MPRLRRIAAVLAVALVAGAGTLASAGSASAAAPPAYTFAGVADWDRDGHVDLVARANATGDLWLYPGASVHGYSPHPRVKIGNGWNGYTYAGLVDWDRDGHVDLLARNDTTGDLWLYPGSSVRGYSTQGPVKIGNGWNGWTFVGLGDVNRDGHADLVAKAPFPAPGHAPGQGEIRVYPGASVRGYSPFAPTSIGPGTTMSMATNRFAGTADWERDGHADFVSIDGGNLEVHSHYFTAGGVRSSSIGTGWNGRTLAGLADWDRDGYPDVIARDDATGTLWLYRGAGQYGNSPHPLVQIGNGWS